MTWMRLVPSLSSGRLLSSSGVSCPLATYVTSRFCAARAVICVVRSVHISWATCICIHSWICRRFSCRAVHHNSMQGTFLQIYPLPSGLLSRSAAPGFWGDVVHASYQHIRCQNHQLSIQIVWDAIYGTSDQVLWLPCISPPYRVVYTVSHWWACLNAVSHSIHG